MNINYSYIYCPPGHRLFSIKHEAGNGAACIHARCLDIVWAHIPKHIQIEKYGIGIMSVFLTQYATTYISAEHRRLKRVYGNACYAFLQEQSCDLNLVIAIESITGIRDLEHKPNMQQVDMVVASVLAYPTFETEECKALWNLM